MLSPSELTQIVKMLEQGSRSGLRSALATVVSVSGSSYRRSGARLLVRQDGEVVGSISGGCLERDVIRRCRLAILDSRSHLKRYDTSDEFGLGCRGEIDVLIEPLSIDSAIFSYLRELLGIRNAAILITSCSVDSGLCAVDHAFLPSEHDVPHTDMGQKKSIARVASECMQKKQTCSHSYESEKGVQERLLFEYFAPVPKLVICGAGPEAVPLARCADALGFSVVVMDDRPGTISRIQRSLPETVTCLNSSPSRVFEELRGVSGVACVIGTHNIGYDERILCEALASKFGYIGLLGPRRRFLQLAETLLQMGFEKRDISAVRAPIGLDIGSSTPEHIALSILAEVQALTNERAGGFLRDRKAPIHDRSTTEIDIAAA